MTRQFYALIIKLIEHEFDTKNAIMANNIDALGKNILLLAASQRHVSYLNILKILTTLDPSLKDPAINLDLLIANEEAFSSECRNNITEYASFLTKKCNKAI
jgi:hypothetical protein